MDQAARRLEQVFSELSGNLREMLSVIDINASFISEMVRSNDENVASVESIYAELRGNSALSEQISEHVRTSVGKVAETTAVVSAADATMRDVGAALADPAVRGEVERVFSSRAPGDGPGPAVTTYSSRTGSS